MMPNVLLVHTPRLQAREDFEDIGARIEAIDGDLKSFVATNGQPNAEVNEKIRSEPTLVFSPVPIRDFKPVRGRIYQGAVIDKITQYRRLVEIGLATPKTKLLTRGDVFVDSEWGPHVVIKPFSPNLQSNGAMTYRVPTQKLNHDLNFSNMFDRYDIEGGALVQQYINAGLELEYHRVLTLFGEPLYAVTTSLKEPTSNRSGYPTETIAIATQSYAPNRKKFEMITDNRYLDFARRAYAAFPERALQAVDIVRCHDADRLYLLEMNLGGNTWHFSSQMIESLTSSPRKLREYKNKKIRQFGAFDVAARVLALRARTDGL